MLFRSPRVDDLALFYWRTPLVEGNLYFDPVHWPVFYIREVELDLTPTTRALRVVTDSLWEEVEML